MAVHWSKELSLELLSLVAEEPVLWARLDPGHKDPEARLRAWRRVQAAMPVLFPASELEKHTEMLLARHARLEAKVRDSVRARAVHPSTDPKPPVEVFSPKWFAFEPITRFLRAGRYSQMSAAAGDGGAEKPPTFQEQFKLFSKFGDRDSDGKHIKLTQSDKWMRQAKVIDGKKITATDTGICFKKLKHPKLTESDYNVFLEDLAKSKGFDVSELKTKMVNCGPPGFTSTVNSAKAPAAVERLTDPSKYTGSHKERFDGSGKGKGLAGRRDDVDASGYVSGYGNKNTYDKEHPTN